MRTTARQFFQRHCIAVALTICTLFAFNTSFAQKKGNPTEQEVKNCFIKKVKDNVEGMGWKDPWTTFQSIKIAQPVKYNFVDVGVQTCYPVKVSWTNGYSTYNSKYSVAYTGDFYRFYRNEFGDLVMGEHGSFENSKVTNTHL